MIYELIQCVFIVVIASNHHHINKWDKNIKQFTESIILLSGIGNVNIENVSNLVDWY